MFYDPILSKDNTHSCASCHFQSNSFSDPNRFSIGVDGLAGDKNASALINLAWNRFNFWDGRVITLEEQALDPITNELELHSSWTDVVSRIKEDTDYRELFFMAFNTVYFDSIHVVKAIAQFERTLISGNSKYDKFVRNEVNLDVSELRGLEIFNSEKGDCFHCHSYPLLTSNDFHNNGLDPEITMDNGRMDATNDPFDKGKFKSPSIRNVELTAPYMHDGRFNTLEEVIEHYSSGVISNNWTTSKNFVPDGGFQFTDYEKESLIAFLKTLRDEKLTTHRMWSDPFDPLLSNNYIPFDRLVVMPNPMIDQAVIEFENKGNRMTLINIYTMSGQLMKADKTADSRYILDKTIFESGTYIIEVIQGDKKSIQKVVVR